MPAHRGTARRGLSEDERAIRELAATAIIRGWLEFSTLRYYAVDLRPVAVERRSGDTVLTLMLRVPHWEIERAVWATCNHNPSKVEE